MATLQVAPQEKTLPTVDELLTLGADVKAEVIDGEVIVVAPTYQAHGVVGGLIVFYLNAFVRPRNLGLVMQDSVAYRLEGPESGLKNVRVPDVSYVAWERVPEDAGDFQLMPDYAPDLAVEVLSPSDRYLDVIGKVRYFLEKGSQQVWLVNPMQQEVQVFTPDNINGVTLFVDATLAGGELLPGLELPVAAIFDVRNEHPDPDLLRRLMTA